MMEASILSISSSTAALRLARCRLLATREAVLVPSPSTPSPATPGPNKVAIVMAVRGPRFFLCLFAPDNLFLSRYILLLQDGTKSWERHKTQYSLAKSETALFTHGVNPDSE